MASKLERLLLSAATAALLGAPGLALAQQGGPLSEIEDDSTVVPPFDLTADQIDDIDVTTVGGDSVGEIEAILVDGSGEPVAFAVEVDDLLNLDDEERIIRLDQVRLEDGRFVTDMSKNEIKALPIWDD